METVLGFEISIVHVILNSEFNKKWDEKDTFTELFN